MDLVRRVSKRLEAAGECGICGTPCGGFTECACDRPAWAPASRDNLARAAIAEVLDAMEQPSEDMTHAGFTAREHRMNMGESANAVWKAMLAQFRAENTL